MNNYILAKKIVEKKYNKNNTYYPLYVLSLYGLLNKYNNNKDIVINVFYKTNFIIDDGPIKNIIEKANITNIDLEDNDNEETGFLGLSNQGYNFCIDENNNIITSETKPFIICDKRRSINKILNIFIHEMNHLIKGYKNGHKQHEDKNKIYYSIRSGINYYVCEYEKNTERLIEETYNEAFDEAINTIQTTEIIQDIKSLDGIIPDKRIQKFLNRLDKDFMEKDYGYEIIVPIVRKLWNIEKFKTLIENNIVEGKIDVIVKEIDNLLGENSYENIGITLDNIYILDSDKKNKEKLDEEIEYMNNIIKMYKEKVLILK